MSAIGDTLQRASERILPRILTQAGRDPNTPAWGCFDRNWWHYKIRDYPSIILQQGGYAAWLAGQLPACVEQADALRNLAEASCIFWNLRAVKRGAFEEYYPWEQGYPPLAFSTLAVMKLCAAGVVPAAAIEAGARIAAAQLCERFEAQAANQQVAGLAALAWLRRSFPALVADADFERQAERTLALQYDEGWFEEYGGPDLGYLSVTIDCLWDLFDATGEARFRDSAMRAAAFIVPFVRLTGRSIGLHNARNTDYLVPYGLARTALEGGPDVLTDLWTGADEPDHFLAATDDRYLCHYIGASVLRAATLLRGGTLPVSGSEPPASHVFPRSGHVLHAGETRALISLRKGGILSLLSERGAVTDFGWVVKTADAQHVNHWWSPHWTFAQEGSTWTVRGELVPHREHESTPWKHMALRLASFVAGRRLIGRLKKTLIFKEALSPYRFERRIALRPDGAEVTDRIEGLPGESIATIEPAPRSSKRHVASADSYHPEDLVLVRGFDVSRETRRVGGLFQATTRYRRLRA